jgi:capsular exopolysaccharide synthesis family protein
MEDEVPESKTGADFATRFFNQLQRYRKLVLHYFWIPLLTVALCLGVQWWLLKHTAPLFASTGRMIVNVKLSIPTANVYNEELENFFGTQAALMQSDTVTHRARAILQSTNPALVPSPVTLSVSPVPKTSIFSLQAVGGNPEYTQAYLQATMEEYIRLKKELLSHASTATQSAMEEELRQLAIQLDACKQEVVDFQTSNSVVFLQPAGGNSAAERLSVLNHELADKRSELQLLTTMTLDENMERMQSVFAPFPAAVMSNKFSTSVTSITTNNTWSLADEVNGSTPGNLGQFEAAYLVAKRELILLESRRDELTNCLAPTSGEVVDLNEQISIHQKLLGIFRKESEQQLKNRQHALELEVQDLSNQVTEWEAKALEVSKKLAEFDALKEKRQRLQTQYDQVQVNLQTLDLNKGISQESVTILEPASWPLPVSAERMKHLIMSVLIGLVLAGAILMFINGLNDRPGTYTELAERFDLPILGQIPKIKLLKKSPAPGLLQLDDPRYPMTESYRSLRSAFLYKDVLNGDKHTHHKSIVITSACPNDGKTITAANLAITFAQAGARVLLVDADLRRGVMHEFFQAPESPGLTEVLANECPWNTAVVQTAIPNLWLLPKGEYSKHPSSHLFARVGHFISEISGFYDYYIFDTVPVMVADDVLSLAPHVDSLMMVVRAGSTSGRVTKAALDLLHLRHVNVAGLVFNAIPPRTSDYHHYRYKEYYS